MKTGKLEIHILFIVLLMCFAIALKNHLKLYLSGFDGFVLTIKSICHLVLFVLK
ncbi:MAG: hypothetical protein HQK88_08215 [Nitrospirae bacterium]|nr:hypothetical protein [Nitrospirota bacterium]MBF0534870.1 hypothetical protein [Nitrospirota bacterium]MBF0616785.1 hypothetical protein [Nitrospirota bacterium]